MKIYLDLTYNLYSVETRREVAWIETAHVCTSVDMAQSLYNMYANNVDCRNVRIVQDERGPAYFAEVKYEYLQSELVFEVTTLEELENVLRQNYGTAVCYNPKGEYRMVEMCGRDC